MNALQYQILTENGLDKKVIQVLEEAFQSKDESTATKGDLEVTKLALQKEIKEVELRLRKEIEEVKREIEVVRREIEGVRREIEVVRREIEGVKLALQKEIRRSDMKMVWLLLGILSPMYLGILSVALKVFFF